MKESGYKQGSAIRTLYAVPPFNPLCPARSCRSANRSSRRPGVVELEREHDAVEEGEHEVFPVDANEIVHLPPR